MFSIGSVFAFQSITIYILNVMIIMLELYSKLPAIEHESLSIKSSMKYK